MIRVLLVDDQTLVRQGIQVLLDGETDIDVIGEASNGREAIALTRQLQPHIVLMDIRMPEVDGVEATRQIIEDSPDTGVIILTTFDDDEYVFEKHTPPEWKDQLINLEKRIGVLKLSILFAAFGFLFNMLTVFGLYLQELFIARIIFGSCCLSMMISIIFFIIEIQISTKALRLHLSDMDIQFKE